MGTHKLRARLAGAASIGAVAMLATMTVGMTAASAGTAPPDPAFEVAPHFYNGTVNTIRDAGSDTTIFLMTTIGDLYSLAGLYGCTLNSATGQSLFNDGNNGVSPYPATQEEYFCQGSHLAVGNLTATATSNVVTVTGGGNFPASLSAGQAVNSLAPSSLFAGGTTISSTSGSPITSITLSNPASVSTTTGVLSFATGQSANIDTTDAADNWSLTEVETGVDAIGSGAGQKQLCGNEPSPYPVDFARSSKPIVSTASGGCATEAETGFAKDGVPIVDFPTVNPSTQGTSTFSDATTGVDYKDVNGGNIGSVSTGWLPGDPVNGSADNGTPLTDLSNADNGGGTGSTAYRLWCASGSSRITDWGQLTNLGPNMEVVQVSTTATNSNVTISNTGPLAGVWPSAIVSGDAVSGPGIPGGTTVSSVSGNTLTLSQPASATSSGTGVTLTFNIGSKVTKGSGASIGLPVRMVGINSSSGTEATFASYANSGQGSSGGCNSSMNPDAANDPNSATAASGNPAHISLENNASQVELFASGDFPSDNVDQAIEASTSLDIESNGVVNTNPHAGQLVINGTTYPVSKLTENGGHNYTTAQLLNNLNPTARTLFNIYRTDTIRASTAGFLNWICDSNSAFQKGTDNNTGANYNDELTNIINTQYGFIRLNDNSSPPSGGGTPADGLTAPNTTCAPSVINVSETSGTNTLTVSSGTFPSSFAGGDSIVGDGIPASTTIVSGGGTNTLTISNNASASSSTATVSVPGQPSVTSVPSANLNK